MNHSQMKKSIDKVIGEERWMTSTLAKQMTTPLKNNKKNIVLIPIFTVVLMASIALFLVLYTNPKTTASTLNETNILNYVEDEKLGNTIVNYMKAIEQEKVEELTTLSTRINDEMSANKVIEKYSNVNFSTISVLNVVPISNTGPPDHYYIYFTHNQLDTTETMMHVIHFELKKGQWVASENIEAVWVPYEPFVAPKHLTFHYEPAVAIEKNDQFKYNDFSLAHPSIPIENDLTAHFYNQANTIQFVIQKGNNYYPIANLTKQSSKEEYSFQIIENAQNHTYYALSSSEIGYLNIAFYNETIEKFQVLYVEEGAKTFFADVDGNEIYDIFINNKNPIVATVEVGQLVAATPEHNIKAPWDSSFISFEYNSKAVSLRYHDVHGEKYANYLWQYMNEATYLNDTNMSGMP